MPTIRIGDPIEGSVPVGAERSMKTMDQRSLLHSVGVGLVLAAGIALMWWQFIPHSLPLGSPSLFALGVVMLALSVGHEALHMLGFPRFGLDANTVIGFWPRIGSPYVQHLAPMTRNRFLLAVVLPFLALTILPFALAANGIGPVAYLSWISVANCFGAASDIYIFTKVATAVPRKAWVVDSGKSLHWGRN